MAGRHKKSEANDLAKHLPFKIGQVVEAKSFEVGYRGAWFACKIMEIDTGSRNQLRYKLKYMHFPDEPLHWSQAYQQRIRGLAKSTELMLRPLPPPILHEKDASHATYDGVVVVPDVWEVGDLVNWWCDEVWWEATVTEILEDAKVQISLSKKPFGEGGVHIAEAPQLRPSLLWSNSGQWTLPISKKKANGKPAARTIELSSTRWLEIGDVDEQLSGQVKELVSTPLVPVKLELGHGKILDGTNSDTKTVPCLEVLRRAAEVFVNTTEGNHLLPQETFQQANCTSSGTNDDDDDSDYIFEALQQRKQISRRRNRKFKRYRKQINRAVDLNRRTRFKKHIFSDCKIIDSSDESSRG